MNENDLFHSELLPCMEGVYQRAVALVGNTVEAEDFVQETYLKAHRSLGSYRSEGKAQAWLNRILYGLVVDHWRRQKRLPDVCSTEEMPDLPASKANGKGPVSALALEAWSGDEVLQALRTLPDPQRIVFLAVVLDGWTYEEAAEVFELPVGTIRSRIARSRQFLRKKLFDYARKNGFGSETTYQVEANES